MKTMLLALLSILISAGTILDCPQRKVAQSSPSLREYKDTVYQNEYSTVVTGCFIENDTTFLLKEYDKEKGKQYLNTFIYIEYDRNSIYHKGIALPIFKPERDLDDLNEWRKYRQERQKPPLLKVDLSGLPTDWIPLHSYQKRFYVSKPCEVDAPHRRYLTDSTLTFDTMEFYFNAIQKFEKKSESLYYIETENQEGNPLSPNQIYIHIIDRQKQIAIWECRKGNESRYELMIPTESAKYFDMIVCQASRQKFIHNYFLMFDKINLKALLKHLKR